MLMIEVLTEDPLSPPSTLGPHRARDYFALPDEPRCELIYGRLYMSPAPIVGHQEVVGMLYRMLDDHAQAVGGRALVSPVDVVLADHSVVQPDVIYVSDERRAIIRRHVEGPPDLAIEILSPGSRRRDRGAKVRLYAESGIREYWIVDPERRTFEFLVSRDGMFGVVLPEDDVYASSVLPGLRVDLASFWREHDRRVG
jgi:Uma2 family endonuclease